MPRSVLTTTACLTGNASVMMGIDNSANPKPAMICTNAAMNTATATTMSCVAVTVTESATYAGHE